MRFGIYPGGYSAAADDAGPPDDPPAIQAALTRLQGDAPFLVRGYLVFDDPGAPTPARPASPERVEQYAVDGRRLHLAAQFHSASGDVDGFADFVRRLLRDHGGLVDSVQVGEEVTVTDNPVLDGAYPRAQEAVVSGVLAAAEEIGRLGLPTRVGTNLTPLFGPAECFLADLVEAGGDRFRRALDFVGLDFFPDVFSPPVDDLGHVVRGLLSHHRSLLDAAGLTHTELWVTENGWPTGPGRSEERQAEVLAETLAAATDAGVSTYLHFALRDADSSGEGLLHRFGLMDDEYRPKPAFEVYRKAVAPARMSTPAQVGRASVPSRRLPPGPTVEA